MTGFAPILTFHSLDPSSAIISFDPAVFVRVMRSLVDAGFRSIAMSELGRLLARGEPVPNQRFAITFDDGYRSVFECAFPVLVELDLAATLFVCSGDEPIRADGRIASLESREMLSWRQVSELHAAGVEVGSHGTRHHDLTRRRPGELTTELRESRDRLEQFLGHPVVGLSYPFGRVNEPVRARASEEYEYAVTDRLAMVESASALHLLPRIETFYFRGDRRFATLRRTGIRAGLRILDLTRRSRRAWESRDGGQTS